ncbi:MAG: ShlB/FhaC/HecB family hemolysin secretion/activation protein [Pseudanabaenales cyanobacterium]|nr:ShlB/FhaC/HecB family hemolysin secretion/activation protein [Pseudanabaenales cyanobacterium]
MRWKFLPGFSLVVLLGFALRAAAQSTPSLQSPLPAGVPEDVDPIAPPIPEPPLPLPVAPPEPLPEPSLETPATPPPTAVPAAPDIRFSVSQIEVLGSTVLQAQIAALVKPYENRDVAFDDLIELRSAITQLYIEDGYITSGAFLPINQDLSDGVVQIQVVEGELEQISITGLKRLRRGYVRNRLALATAPPLNQQDLEATLQLLQLNPLIEQVNAELTTGRRPGSNILQVDLKESPAFHANLEGDNYRSPSIGSEQFQVGLAHDNFFGFGDRLNAGYSTTDGLDSVDVAYAIPLNAREGTLRLRYNNNDSLIVEEDFEDLGIRSETETFSISFRQPLTRTPSHELALGLGIDRRRSQTFILDDDPFSFSVGPEDGESNITVIRFFQDWVNRDARTVLAARSQFSFGIDAFDATVNDSGTDGRFFTWLGQFQWVQQLPHRILLLVRVDAQLTPDSLLPLEQFSLGGVNTVRGYRQNQLVSDNGVLSSVELRIPLTANPQRFQLTPFVDVGYAWNNRTPGPTPNTIAGLGLGARWQIAPTLAARLDYGVPLVEIDGRGGSLQGNGLYFSVRYQPF